MLNDFVFRLLENSLVISAAILLLWGLSRLLRNKTSPQTRLVCWLAVIIGMLLPVRPALYTINLSGNVSNHISSYVSGVFEQSGSNEFLMNIFLTGMSLMQPDAAPATVVNTVEHENQPDAVAIQTSGGESKPAATILPPYLRDGIPFILWGLGSVTFLTVCAFRYRRSTHSIRRWSRPVTDERLLSLMEDVCREVKLRRNLRLAICPLVTMPVAIGLWNPIIILPDEYIECRHLRLILLHETLHCKRGDIWFKALSLIAMSAHWFNPLAYFMNRSLSAEIELACDAAVLRRAGTGQRYEYGEIILRAARQGRNSLIPFASASFSGSGKSLKRRLSAIIERKTARRWVSVCCAAVMICSVLLTGLAGCNSGSDIATVKADMTPTTELVIYTPPLFENHWWPVIERYRELYPDVNVTVEEFAVDRSVWNYVEVQEGYTTRLISEIAAGGGPDVIFLNSLFSPNGETDFDIHKMMDSGKLLDLKETLTHDESFNMDGYVANVLDAGVYKGRQFLLPLSFNAPVTTSNAKTLERIGLDLSRNTDFISFMNEALRCFPAAKENPDFKTILTSYQVPFLFQSSGVQLIDYENKKVLPDEQAFRDFCDSYKQYYTDESTDVPFQEAEEGFFNGSVLYKNDAVSVYGVLADAAIAENNGGAAISAIRGMDGKLNATTIDYAGINAASKNQFNAYNFIKLLLSPEVQSLDNDMQYVIRGFPVHKDSLTAVCEREWKAGENNTYTHWTGSEYPLKPVSQEKYDLFMELVTGVDTCTIIDFGPSFSALEIYMMPYFNGEKSYEDCVAELKSKFEVFLSE